MTAEPRSPDRGALRTAVASDAQNLANFSILDAMDHPAIWARWFKDRSTWRAWRVFVKVAFWLPLDRAELKIYQKFTGRRTPPKGGASEIWLICGRRAGKSFILALCAVFLAVFVDWSDKLTPGESGMVLIVAASKRQARIIFRYCRALIMEVPALAQLVVRETKEALEFRSGAQLEVQAASFRTTRGYALLGGLGDEFAFLETAEGAANPDQEIVVAQRAALVPGGKLIFGSSPFGRVGAMWDARQRFYGQEDAPLVWHASSSDMNPVLDRKMIEEAYRLDHDKAAREFGAEFIDGAGLLIPPALVEGAVDDVEVRPAVGGNRYVAFIDAASGVGGGDCFAGVIAHAEGDKILVDLCYERAPPYNPTQVIRDFAALCQPYGLRPGPWTGDKFGANFLRNACNAAGVEYRHSRLDATELYLELLPLLTASRLRIPRNNRLMRQLLSLRRSYIGGRERVEHPRTAGGGHGDLANAMAGAAWLASQVDVNADALTGDLGFGVGSLAFGAPDPGPEPWRNYDTITGQPLGNTWQGGFGLRASDYTNRN
jgi:hypothetical protein